MNNMPRLKNRQLQIPGGLVFYLPVVKWKAPKGASFNVICDGLERVIRGNPKLAEKHKWPTDRQSIEDWVDHFNAVACLRMGWDAYIVTGTNPTVPKSSPRHLQETLQSLSAAAVAAKELVAGARTLMEWIDSKEPAVPAEESLRRATICSQCPQNQAGDWTKWFTVPAAEIIKRQVEKLHSRQLSTPRDDDLHLCVACHCPLKVKVHTPIAWIKKRLSPGQLGRLRQGRNCWILVG
jgi:hypothetical protein